MRQLIPVLLILCSLSVAKDKDQPSTPTLSADQKISLLKSQRNFLQAQTEADPYIFRLRQAVEDLQREQSKLLEEIGLKPDEWQINPTTFDITKKEQPPKIEPLKEPTPKK